MKYQIKDSVQVSAPVEKPLEVWLEPYEDGVALKCRDRNDMTWFIVQLTKDGKLRRNASIGSQTGLVLGKGNRVELDRIWGDDGS